ncbi:MAG: winged helix-turn-helix domain-containing protein [Christensenellales bacterium]
MQSTSSQTIYCVEDEANIRDLIVYALKANGFDAHGFCAARPFFDALQHKLPDLVLLDIMLPGEDGLSALRKLKENPDTQHICVIMLTAKTAEYDRVVGLDTGADDYITKPFGVMEMIARVKAVLRRTSETQNGPVLLLGDIELNTVHYTVHAQGRKIALTHKEFMLLRFLLQNLGIALTREKILADVWGYDFEGESRTVDMHIKTLRQKLGEAGARIQTVRGVGYRMAN